MFGLFALCLTVGLADSLNPTTVGPALFLATTSRARSALIGFIAGVLAVYFLGGLLITLGPGELILSVAPHPRRDVKHIIEIVVGVVAAAVALATWLGRRRLQTRAPRIHQTSPRSAFVLGASIMVVELPTAFPYFAVIAAIVASGRNIVVKVVALAIFNAAFVLPLVAILVVREYAGTRAQERLARFGEWFQRNSAGVVAVLLALASVGFLIAGTVGLLRTPRHRHPGNAALPERLVAGGRRPAGYD